MAIFKCKMCGASLKVAEGATVCICEYCGTQQTLPKLNSNDNNRVNLYDRANHFRRNNEFDKATGMYEQILNTDQTDAEAYWSLVLCRYGIEYVEDPVSRKRIPTVNRTQFTSVFDDDNYKSALQYADVFQRQIYEDEARTINEIQKGILAISQKEAPFDVFICYKESDNNGRRTPDSVLAQDLYFQLTQEGFKVFFSRITLEDKLGSAYEPYIFAALNSAKVMVVLGTKPAYFNAVWVKNEWSRYLSLMKQGQKKMIVPAYKDMDPYELPEEFSHLQAQDMSRLGFMQDLIRGIKKILGVSETKTTNTQEKISQTRNAYTTETFKENTASLSPLLKRAFIFLEDGNWSSADEYAEKVLDQDPENAQAYLCKLMAELHVKRKEELREHDTPFDENANYQKVLRYGDGELSSTLTAYVEHINARNEKARIENTFAKATRIMKSEDSEDSYKKAAELFDSISGYQNSEYLASECLEKAEKARKDRIYTEAKSKMQSPLLAFRRSAEELFASIAGWKDADEQIIVCKRLIEELKQKHAKLKKKIIVISCLFFLIIAAFAVLFNTLAVPAQQKKEFIAKYGQEMYDKLGVVEEGKYIKFGKYEQDNNLTNGKEDIEWLVLEVKDGKALVVSKYLLDCKPFYEAPVYDGGEEAPIVEIATWDCCILREWLNNEFLKDAFARDEQTMIPILDVKDDKNPDYESEQGADTQDGIFLMSVKEVNKYFKTDDERKCKPTAYAIAQGASVNESERVGKWWLRTFGSRSKVHASDVSVVSVVDAHGNIVTEGQAVDLVDCGIRPAMWISLEWYNIMEEKYNEGIAHMKKGEYEEAVLDFAFTTWGNYKDSEQKLKEAKEALKSSAPVGPWDTKSADADTPVDFPDFGGSSSEQATKPVDPEETQTEDLSRLSMEAPTTRYPNDTDDPEYPTMTPTDTQTSRYPNKPEYPSMTATIPISLVTLVGFGLAICWRVVKKKS